MSDWLEERQKETKMDNYLYSKFFPKKEVKKVIVNDEKWVRKLKLGDGVRVYSIEATRDALTGDFEEVIITIVKDNEKHEEETCDRT